MDNTSVKKENREAIVACFDLEKVYNSFQQCVLEDISQFGEPAFCYNYHHKGGFMNTIDEKSDFLLEKSNLESNGCTFKTIKRELKIGHKQWPCEIVIAEIASSSIFSSPFIDPLGASIGYYVRGYYYILFAEKDESTV